VELEKKRDQIKQDITILEQQLGQAKAAVKKAEEVCA